MSTTEREVKLLAVSAEQLDSVARRPDLGGYPILFRGESLQEDVYHDTDDYRVFRAGFSLRYRVKEGRFRVTVKEILPAGGRPMVRERMELEEELPALPADTSVPPPGAAGEWITPLLGSRGLRPLVKITNRRRKFLLGSTEQPGAELCLDRCEVSPGPGSGTVAGFYEVEIEDRTAGAASLTAMGRQLLEVDGLLPSSLSKFERGLAVLGLLVDARGMEREFETAAHPEDRLIDTAYRVFRKHFERMKANEPGTRIGADPEYLHDMRVSTRRLRAAFRTFRTAIPKERLAGYNGHLKWIAAFLGDIRDLDVYLENLPEYSAALTDNDREALDVFGANLARLRAKARTKMLRSLETRRYTSFVARFDAFLTRGAPKRPRVEAARLPVLEAAPILIRKELKRVLKGGRAIPRVNPPAQSLHDLRILCKRLRYTCEFFAELYGKPMKRFIRSVVRFQDLLGTHQDACVAGETLRNYAARVGGTRKEALRTVLALGQLIASQDSAAAESRAGFRAAWKEFDRKSVHRKMWS